METLQKSLQRDKAFAEKLGGTKALMKEMHVSNNSPVF